MVADIFEDFEPPSKTILATPLPRVVLDDIDEKLVLKATRKTKGGREPSVFDVNWCRILNSQLFSSSFVELRKSFSDFIKSMCIKNYIKNIHVIETDVDNSLETFTASPLIPPEKNPGLRPIGVEEVSCRIVGKVVMYGAKKHVQDTAGVLQVCACQDTEQKQKFMSCTTFFKMMKLNLSH